MGLNLVSSIWLSSCVPLCLSLSLSSGRSGIAQVLHYLVQTFFDSICGCRSLGHSFCTFWSWNCFWDEGTICCMTQSQAQQSTVNILHREYAEAGMFKQSYVLPHIPIITENYPVVAIWGVGGRDPWGVNNIFIGITPSRTVWPIRCPSLQTALEVATTPTFRYFFSQPFVLLPACNSGNFCGLLAHLTTLNPSFPCRRHLMRTQGRRVRSARWRGWVMGCGYQSDWTAPCVCTTHTHTNTYRM